MGCQYETASNSFNKILDITNILFTIIFAFESTFKLIAFGWSYFQNSWNNFDFFVVISSLFDLCLNVIGGNSVDFLTVGP